MFGKTKGQSTNNMVVVAYYDSKSEVYGVPRFVLNEQVFLRDIHNFFDHQSRQPFDQQDQLFTNSEDFAFFKLGEYDRDTGALIPNVPKHLVSLHEVKAAFMAQANANPLDRVQTMNQARQ